MATSTWFPRPGGVSLLSNEAATWQALSADTSSDERVAARDEREATRQRELLAEAMRRWTVVTEAEAAQREREADDLRFARGLVEDHWPAEIRRARQGGVGPDGRVMAERPCLVVDKLGQPIQQVLAEARAARMAIEVSPKGEAPPAGAELRQRLIRAIEQDSNAQAARMWALDRAVKAGRGYYRVLTDYANDGDTDLDIRIARIANQGAIYCDPHATQADWSDMRWAFVVEDVPRDEFKARWPDVEVPEGHGGEESAFSSSVDSPAGWLEDDTIRVAEYFYVTDEPVTAVEGVATEALVLAQAERRTRRRVRWALLTSTAVLAERDWPGRYIPIVFVPGREDVVDGERCWRGIVGPAKDAQRSYNYMRSAQVEAVGLAPRAPWIMAEGQDEGYEQLWDQANTRNFPRLIYKPATFEGTLLPPPARNVAEPAIQAISLAVREADADIKATTGRFDPSLGRASGERSGKAIEALKLQGELSTSTFLDNLAQIAMVQEGRILLDLLPAVYDRPGRVIRLLGDAPSDPAEAVILGQPFVPGPDGRPMPVGMPMPPGAPTGAPGGPGPRPLPGVGGPPAAAPSRRPMPTPKLYVLDPHEDYTVQVTVGRAFQTERQANLGFLQSLLETTKGQVAPLVLDIWAEQMGGPLGRRMAERFKAANPLLAQEGQPDAVPPAVQQQMAQAQQMIQQLQAKLAEAEQAIQVQQARAAAELEAARVRTESAERIAQMQAEVELAKTRATLQSREATAMLDAEAARVASFADHQADLERERLKQQGQRQAAVLTRRPPGREEEARA